MNSGILGLIATRSQTPDSASANEAPSLLGDDQAPSSCMAGRRPRYLTCSVLRTSHSRPFRACDGGLSSYPPPPAALHLHF